MQKTPPRFTKVDTAIGAPELERFAQGWLLDGEIRQHSHRAIEAPRSIADKPIWFLKQNNYSTCGTLELRQFLAYVSWGHERPGGRWGNALMIN